jgi:hypothetical protein
VSGENRIAISRIVNAPPSQIFRVVTDPNMQVEIDGSGMLEAAPGSRRLEAVGDSFEMDMDRDPLGDVPMGKYKVLNTVTRIVPNSLLEWNVGSAEQGPYGHVYGWSIAEVGPDKTEVTNYCDWSDVPENVREHFPIVPAAMMEKSVEKLVDLVGREPKPQK